MKRSPLGMGGRSRNCSSGMGRLSGLVCVQGECPLHPPQWGFTGTNSWKKKAGPCSAGGQRAPRAARATSATLGWCVAGLWMIAVSPSALPVDPRTVLAMTAMHVMVCPLALADAWFRIPVAAPSIVPLRALYQTYIPDHCTLYTQQPCASGTMFGVPAGSARAVDTVAARQAVEHAHGICMMIWVPCPEALMWISAMVFYKIRSRGYPTSHENLYDGECMQMGIRALRGSTWTTLRAARTSRRAAAAGGRARSAAWLVWPAGAAACAAGGLVAPAPARAWMHVGAWTRSRARVRLTLK